MDITELEVLVRDLQDRVAKLEALLIAIKLKAQDLVAILPDGPPDPGRTR